MGRIVIVSRTAELVKQLVWILELHVVIIMFGLMEVVDLLQFKTLHNLLSQNCNITTYVFTHQTAIAIFSNSIFGANSQKAGLRIEADDSSTVIIQDSILPLSTDPSQGYQLVASGTGSILRSRIVSPLDSSSVTCSSSVNIPVEAQIYPNTLLGHYSLSVTSSNLNPIVISTNSLLGLNVFNGTIPWTPTSNGSFMLRLDVWYDGGQKNATVIHTVQVMGCTSPSSQVSNSIISSSNPRNSSQRNTCSVMLMMLIGLAFLL